MSEGILAWMYVCEFAWSAYDAYQMRSYVHLEPGIPFFRMWEFPKIGDPDIAS